MRPKLLSLSMALAAALAVSGCTSLDRTGGGTVEVSFQNPENFTDMARRFQPGDGADEGYLREFREHIERVGSSRLPVGSTLALTITDVDMAGDFEPQHGPSLDDIRIIKSIYPPRITLEYRLTNANGEVVDEGRRQLRNQAFNWTVSPINRDDPLRYEKMLIDDFLRDLSW